jgi:hypothetical protein
MRPVIRLTILSVCFSFFAWFCAAQEPRGNPGDAPKGTVKKAPAGSSIADSIVSRMMAFDKNKDGKLSRDEISDRRLLRLFDQADANKDGVVTKEELSALAKKLADEETANRGRRGGFGPPGGPGGPGGPPPRPGQILPPFLRDMLELTPEQMKQVDELQKEVDSKLAKILTEEQRKRLQEMRPPGRGGRGPGGPGDPPER